MGEQSRVSETRLEAIRLSRPSIDPSFSSCSHGSSRDQTAASAITCKGRPEGFFFCCYGRLRLVPDASLCWSEHPDEKGLQHRRSARCLPLKDIQAPLPAGLCSFSCCSDAQSRKNLRPDVSFVLSFLACFSFSSLKLTLKMLKKPFLSIMSTILSMCGPGWFASNAYNEDSGIKELYRTCLLMDMREMDDRVSAFVAF
jgi:hypothetical protein